MMEKEIKKHSAETYTDDSTPDRKETRKDVEKRGMTLYDRFVGISISGTVSNMWQQCKEMNNEK